ncbi:MAG TPA: SEC-C domain-containing protein [Bryobacteraceae bacterium]|jgi:uncharacterized protein YchJ|nr:SEC-C domain-containing protein [Bryobacteraceae bacterium]
MATSNRIEHGFRSSTVLLPSDDPAQYEALLHELTDHFGPTDLTTERLVREMADAEWRLRRLRSHLASALARHLETVAQRHPELTDPADRESRAIETLAETGCSYTTWLRYESRLQNQYDRAYKAWTAYEDAVRRTAAEAEILVRRAIFVPTPAEAAATVSNVQTAQAQQSAQTQIPRNAPCPCKSGEKYKRCCGRAAPQVLRKAA